MTRTITTTDISLEVENMLDWQELAAVRDELADWLASAQAATDKAREYLATGEYARGCRDESEQYEALEAAECWLSCAEQDEEYLSKKLDELDARLALL